MRTYSEVSIKRCVSITIANYVYLNDSKLMTYFSI